MEVIYQTKHHTDERNYLIQRRSSAGGWSDVCRLYTAGEAIHEVRQMEEASPGSLFRVVKSDEVRLNG